jgi:hypothetical protein
VGKLPTDLLFDGFWPVPVRDAGRFGRIRGGAECVRTHMTDGGSLTGGSGSGRCSRSLYVTHSDAADKPTADFLGNVQLSPSESTRPGNERPRAVIIWGLSLE